MCLAQYLRHSSRGSIDVCLDDADICKASNTSLVHRYSVSLSSGLEQKHLNRMHSRRKGLGRRVMLITIMLYVAQTSDCVRQAAHGTGFGLRHLSQTFDEGDYLG